MIQRYFKAHNVRTNKSEMVPDNVYGNFILYSDHEAAIAEKDAKLMEKDKQIVELRAIIESVDLLVTEGVKPSLLLLKELLQTL